MATISFFLKTSYFLAFSFEILHPCESHNMNPLHVWERLPNNKKYFFYSSLPHWEAFICFKVLELINGFSTSICQNKEITTRTFWYIWKPWEICKKKILFHLHYSKFDQILLVAFFEHKNNLLKRFLMASKYIKMSVM